MDYFSILVVDDEVDFLETLVKRLQKRNIDTVGVTSGEEALAALEKRRFDVIILDIKMPGGMDGIETLREIKRHHPLAEVHSLDGARIDGNQHRRDENGGVRLSFETHQAGRSDGQVGRGFRKERSS